MPRRDPQIAAGYERLRASLGRLKTVALAAEKQPESPQAIADLNRAILGGESSYEFLIGMFRSLNAKDHEKQLAMLSETLAFLRTQKQILAAKLAAKVNEAARKESAQALAAFSDRALAAAVSPTRTSMPSARRAMPSPARAKLFSRRKPPSQPPRAASDRSEAFGAPCSGTGAMAERPAFALAGGDRELGKAALDEVRLLPKKILMGRLSTVFSATAADLSSCLGAPLLTILGSRDRLVSLSRARDVCSKVPFSTLVELDAPHLVIQTKPADVWRAISEEFESAA